VSYKTPKGLVPSPGIDSDSSEREDSETEVSNDISLESGPDEVDLPLQWNGHSRADLLAMWDAARGYSQQGKSKAAENMFAQVLEGLGHLQGTTNEGTSKVAYDFADFYAQTGRMADADRILERLTQCHIDTRGYADRKTQQHVLHTVEILNGWGRPEDALGLLSRSEELLKSIQCGGRRAKLCRDIGGDKTSATQTDHIRQTVLSYLADSVADDPTPAKIDYGLSVTRPHVLAKDEAAEPILLGMIRHCQDHPEQLAVQHLRARGDLLMLYEKLNVVDAHRNAFLEAQDAFNSVWDTFEWDEDRFQCIELMEASLQLAANMIKGGYKSLAALLFHQISEKATSLFGSDDERSVWILITIGTAYQAHTTWDDAEEWFEQAFAAALASDRWDRKDGIVKSLQHAIDNHHFTYLSDEGRPFKTIFGVSGITIRPGRLHLE
jgi:tetratricopeptide (TPR) repeat protein